MCIHIYTRRTGGAGAVGGEDDARQAGARDTLGRE